MTTPAAESPSLVERVAAAVSACPGVAGLHGGTYGDLATYLPGRRVVGVRLGAHPEPVRVGVVLRLDRPIPERVEQIRALVSDLCDGAPVDVTVGDVLDAEDAGPGAPR